MAINYSMHIPLERGSVYMFGKPKNWKINFSEHKELLPIFYERGIEKIFIPDCTTFTGALSEPSDFKIKEEISSLEVNRDYQTEGLVIPKKSAVIFYTADCPVIIFHNVSEDVYIAAHAGFGSIIDKLGVLNDIPFRANESVVDEIMKKAGKIADNYKIYIIGGIEADYFRYNVKDEIYGKGNEKILQWLLERYGVNAVPFGKGHGGISIQSIIVEQFINYGVDHRKIIFRENNTYSNPNWWSHYQHYQISHSVCGRNAIIVLHE